MASHRNDPVFIDKVLTLTREGKSRTEVAALLHISRNAVCGVVTRAGFSPGRVRAWTPERIEKVRELASQKYSQTAIARALGTSSSRINNVIRRHIPELVGHTARESNQVTTMVKKAEARAAYVPPPAEPPTPTMVTLMDLAPGQCKWPLDGRGAATMFCGAAQWNGRVYCHHHSGRAFVAA